LPAAPRQPRHIARCGGASRAETVANGLLALLSDLAAAEHDWVLVHDAARCLLEPAWIDRLIAACDDDEVGGLLALPLADTLKQEASDAPGRSAATVSRTGKWAAQTPQMFRVGLLRRALIHAASDPTLAASITDEASAVELLGHAPLLVRGDALNFKLTFPEDFALAERLLRST
jgi:2-C-methyl-D-erythritol 4-phosphate cytidylyltransferase